MLIQKHLWDCISLMILFLPVWYGTGDIKATLFIFILLVHLTFQSSYRYCTQGVFCFIIWLQRKLHLQQFLIAKGPHTFAAWSQGQATSCCLNSRCKKIQDTVQIFKNIEPTTMKHIKFSTITLILTGHRLFSFLEKAPFVVKWMIQFTCQLFLHSGFLSCLCSRAALKVVKAIKAVLFKIYTHISWKMFSSSHCNCC